MHFLDLQTDFFLPIWRRIAVVLVCFGWSVIEFTGLAPTWGVLFAGIGFYAVWQFFLTGWPAKQTLEEHPKMDTSQDKTLRSEDHSGA